MSESIVRRLHAGVFCLLLLFVSWVNTAAYGEVDGTTRNRYWMALPAGLGLGYLISQGDQDIYSSLHRHRDPHLKDLSHFLTRSGDGKTVIGVVGLTYGAAYLTDNVKLQDTVYRGIESLAVSGVIAETIKHTAGRQRPIYANGDDRWNGPKYFFRMDKDYFDSFPSGHATAAFALATTIALQYPDGWVPYAAYTWAAGVSLSRIYNEAHWTSDVLVGSAIGFVTARQVNRYHEKHGKGFLLIPKFIEAGGTQTLGLDVTVPLP
jgi:membrane-associated phospholipid phosphatase